MKSLLTNKTFIALCVAFIVSCTCAGIIIPRALIEIRKEMIRAERDVQLERIEQQHKTERTEERSQFWQKVVPWGDDEAEKGN